MSTRENEGMDENVVEEVVKASGLGKKEFSERASIPRSTLYSHLKGLKDADTIPQLFWRLSKRVQEQQPELFEEVVLGIPQNASSAEVDQLKYTIKMKRELEQCIKHMEDPDFVTVDPEDPEDLREQQEVMLHLSALKRIFAMKEIKLREKIEGSGRK